MTNLSSSQSKLLAELQAALGNESRISLAILFGSMARGDADCTSDVDLLVDHSDPMYRTRLALQLERKIGRKIDIASLERAELGDPFFLLQTLDEGLVIIDRDCCWPRLLARRSEIHARAMQSHRRQMAHVSKMLEGMDST